MSDRRPEKLWKRKEHRHPNGDLYAYGTTLPATVDEVLAYIRAGVESGTIKGVESHLSITNVAPLGLSPGSYLIIPVSGEPDVPCCGHSRGPHHTHCWQPPVDGPVSDGGEDRP